MHAHHLDAYATHRHLRRKRCNGVCLCEECHRAFHKAKGLSVCSSDFYEAFGFPNPDVDVDWEAMPPVQIATNLAHAIQMMRLPSADMGDAVEDLKKARWYIDREIKRLGGIS